MKHYLLYVIFFLRNQLKAPLVIMDGAQRMRQVIVLKPVVVSDIIQIPILHIIITGMGSHSWQGGHVISCLLGHVIESQSNFNLQVSLV